MSIYPWIAAIAFGLASFASPLSVESQEREAGNGNWMTHAEQSPNQNSPWAIPVEIIENHAETEARQAREDRAEQRELDYLAAQKGVDKATQKLATYAIYQTILIALGTAVLIYTLYLTRQANRAATRGAHAAEGAVSVTRRIGEAQVRAYITATPKDFGRPKEAFFVDLTIKNCGQTPARNMALAADIKVLPYPHNRDGFSVGVGKIDLGETPNQMGAGSEVTIGIGPAEFERKVFDAAAKGKEWRFYLIGKITYRDVFGNQYFSEFCYSYGTNGRKRDAPIEILGGSQIMQRSTKVDVFEWEVSPIHNHAT